MSDRVARRALLVPLVFAGLKFVLQILAIHNYGYFRDELYYIACSKHLAWGYVDQPPFSIATLAAARALLGDSLPALRLLPALCGAATVFLTGVITRELGGGRFAQAIACLCAVLAPVWLMVDHFFSMNTFDTFFWTLSAWLLLRALDATSLRTDRFNSFGARVSPATGTSPTRPASRYVWWVALGVVMGVGLLNKTSMLWFGGGLALGLIATPYRRLLLTPAPWLAGAIAALCFAPHVLWQVHNGWPTLEFMRNAAGGKMVRTGFADFWWQQFLVMSPVTAPVSIIGLVALLARSPTRILGVVFVAVAALLVVSGSSRPNYLAVAYAPLFAAGGMAIERFASRRRRAWLRPAAVTVLLLLGAPIVPMGLPILPVDRLVAYLDAVGVRPRAQEHTAEGDLPQVFADMFGWEDLVRRVARVYHALPEDQRAKCAIYTRNYGEAGAIDFFGPRYGLPAAISSHNNYWLWGTHGATGEVLILVGGRRDDRHADFRSVTLADTTHCDHCMPYENGAPIFVCLGLNQPLESRWRQIRRYE